MLLDPNFVHKPAPTVVWLTAVDPEVASDSATISRAKRRTNKLRRLQSQNFLERAVWNVTHLFQHDQREIA